MKYFEAAGVLLLLSVFFAYVLAPAIPVVRRRIRTGPRRRPISDASAILILYALLLVPAGLIWSNARDDVRQWITVTAPATVDHLFSGPLMRPFDNVVSRMPLPGAIRRGVLSLAGRVATTLERETRATLAQCIEAARYAAWLLVAPVIAFLLLTTAPAFQRSTLRVLPRGHLQWRAEEYLRDVNSALAGYVRAQASAALIVGLLCVVGFSALRVPSAISLGVMAGVLELVPAIGPLTALLIACAQAGEAFGNVVVFMAALRIVQDYAVYPRLIRRGMHLSTPAVIVTIWIGAALAKAPGVILAIPVAGLISVSLRHLREYREIERLVATVR